MLKYYNTLIGLQEVPNEVSLVINISNCPFKCPECHAKELWGNVGQELTPDALTGLIWPYIGEITCVAFMGGDREPHLVNYLAEWVREHYPGLKIAWYSGNDGPTLFTNFDNFDYLKFGPYKKKLGPLTSKTTNQRFYKVVNGRPQNITEVFWK